ncbi:MAG TPA: hypothetical protein VL358_15580 [Caulobacteraceae bacterium]|jgi:hypothetical protein|nr:hypothetical protein [Caulobacteraceae bacterium]
MSSVPDGPPAVSVLLATPCYGGMANILFFNSVLRLQKACQARGLKLEVLLTGGDALITRARSRIATDFLRQTDHSHLLFVDADIGFDPEHLFRLLKADKPLVGGVYPLKTLHWDKIPEAVRRGARDLQAAALGYVVRFLPNPDQTVALEDGFGPVAYVGTGFMLIAREVLETLAAAHPELHCSIDDVNAESKATVMFFDTMIDPATNEHLSEDYAFCKRWRDCGGEIWADFQSPMSHIGHATYTGGLIDALAT